MKSMKAPATIKDIYVRQRCNSGKFYSVAFVYASCCLLYFIITLEEVYSIFKS